MKSKLTFLLPLPAALQSQSSPSSISMAFAEWSSTLSVARTRVASALGGTKFSIALFPFW